MLAYILLICALSGFQRTSAHGRVGCRLKEAHNASSTLYKEFEKKCSHDNAPTGNYIQSKCVGFEVPKNEENCNLTCFLAGVQKYHGEPKNTALGKFVSDFKSRAKGCQAKNISCYSSCEEMQTENAINFWKRLIKSIENVYMNH